MASSAAESVPATNEEEKQVEENPTVNAPIKFAPISADAQGEDAMPMTVESLCMGCFEQGTTTLFFTQIPFFREVVVMAFECPHCGLRNNEIQPAAAAAEKGCRFTLTVRQGDINSCSRQVVKSEPCSLRIPEIDFEIPPNTQKGILSTVEGMLRQAVDNLQLLQAERRKVQPEVADQIDAFCDRLGRLAAAEESFTLELDDPSGNSFIQARGHPKDDKDLKVEYYDRTKDQARELGLLVQEDHDAAVGTADPVGTRDGEIKADDPHHGLKARGAGAAAKALAKMQGEAAGSVLARYAAPEEVIVLPGRCSACAEACDTRMFQTSIPFFKEVIVMSNSCDHCGYKNSEIKSGGGISERGREIRLAVSSQADLGRDVIKAESASVSVPEIDLEVTSGSLGGLITTVEGLIMRVKDELSRTASFALGDSAEQVAKQQWTEFFDKLDRLMEVNEPWTLILHDPLDNTFVAPAPQYEDPYQDPQLTLQQYERTAEEDDHYGISHLKDMERQEQGLAGMKVIDEEQEGEEAEGKEALQLQLQPDSSKQANMHAID